MRSSPLSQLSPPSPLCSLALVLALVLALGGVASAHDFWIEPLDRHPQAPAIVSLRLRVGEHLQGDPVARTGAKIERFLAVGPDGGELPAVGTEGKDPAGHVRAEKPGLYLIGYHSKHSFVELEPEKFGLYLEEEGLERIVAERLERGEATQKARERYSRCAKAIVATSDATEMTGFDRSLGFPFELIPEKNPCAASAAGAELPVVVRFEGKPKAGVLVVAINAREPIRKVSQRSDDAGRVTLALPRPGFWLVKAVHMVRAESPGTDQAQWESFWASLTFDTGEATAAEPAK